MLIVSTTPQQSVLRPYLEESATLHKHLCPRQVLGVRIGLRGLRELGFLDESYLPRFDNRGKRLLTIVESDGCGADGVSVATNCHVGRRTMRVLDYGKVAATLVDTKTSLAIRVWPRNNVRQLAKTVEPDSRSHWHAYLEAYQIIPDEKLLRIQPVLLTQSLTEILSRPQARVNCDFCGEEILNEREVLVNGRILCQSCAGNRYYVKK